MEQTPAARHLVAVWRNSILGQKLSSPAPCATFVGLAIQTVIVFMQLAKLGTSQSISSLPELNPEMVWTFEWRYQTHRVTTPGGHSFIRKSPNTWPTESTAPHSWHAFSVTHGSSNRRLVYIYSQYKMMEQKSDSREGKRPAFSLSSVFLWTVLLVHTSIQVDDNIDSGDEDLGGNEDNDDPLEVFTCITDLSVQTHRTYRNTRRQYQPHRKRSNRGKRTMRMTQLILQHLQQIAHDTDPLLHELDALVHLEIRPYGLVDGVELGFRPHKLRRVEHTALQMDVDAQDEELADLHVDLAARQIDAARARDGRGDRLRRRDGGVEEVFVEGGLCACHRQ